MTESIIETSSLVTPAPPKSVLREYLETVVLCVLFLLFARGFVFMQSKIPTESMLDTLLVGDYILVNRFLFGGPGDGEAAWLGQRQIRRGDVIVFRYPGDPDIDYVKRVIGEPGDRVELRTGVVFINGRALSEPYLRREAAESQASYREITVPPDSYFCMGDNRDHSLDSRAWGPVPRSLVKGRAFFLWFSYQEDKNDHLNTGLRRWASIGKKLVGFPTKTRWSRIFSRIR